MKINLLFYVCLLGVILNIPVATSLTNVSPILLVVEYLCFFVISKAINNKFLRDYSVIIRRRFFVVYLTGFVISLFFLGLCWSPNLTPDSPDWGFDPQRYYLYAHQILEKGYYDGWVGSGFNGIVYFYAFVFGILGFHPLVPLYLNYILALVSVLMLFKMFEREFYIKPHYFAWLLLIPEFLYYNIMVSKDVMCQYGVIFILYWFYKFNHGRKTFNLILLIVSFVFLIMIRSPYAFGALASIMIFLLFFSSRTNLFAKIFISSLMVGTVLFGLKYTNMLSTSDSMTSDWNSRIEDTMTGKMNAMEDGSGLAAALTPNNIPEVFVFGVVRSVAYLSPSGYYRFFDEPSWYTFAALTTLLTGLITPLFILVIYYYLLRVLKKKRPNTILVLLFFLFLMFLTGFSTPNFIHSRYRVTYEMLYFTIVILAYAEFGKKCFVKIIKKWIFAIAVLIPIWLLRKL